MTDNEIKSVIARLEARAGCDGTGTCWNDWRMEDAAAALRALLAERADPWRPIESAPRDGTRVLVFVPGKWVPSQRRRGVRKTHSRIISAFWSESPNDGAGYILSDHAKTLREKHGGFWAGDPQGRRALTGLPTDWMPLPPPPKERGK